MMSRARRKPGLISIAGVPPGDAIDGAPVGCGDSLAGRGRCGGGDGFGGRDGLGERARDFLEDVGGFFTGAFSLKVAPDAIAERRSLQKKRIWFIFLKIAMDICLLGGYDRAYPRNAVLRRGLWLAGAAVSECQVRPGYKFWTRYPLLISRWLSGASSTPSHSAAAGSRGYLLVPEFCQKDVPLARCLSALTSRRVIFDPLASRFETKIVDWGWRSSGSLAAWWNRLIDELAFRSADLILADTKAHRDYYVDFFGLPPGKFAVVPVGFDDRVFSRDLARAGQASRAVKPAGEPLTVVFFGSFLPLHGVDFIIEAARRVWEKDRSIRFLLIGGGRTFPWVRERAGELGLGNVDFEGWKSQAALAETVANRADICLGIFGQTEKAARVVPHKIFQSMALGKPVVTARTPAVEEFFEHGRNIFFCDKTGPESLAEAILALKNDPGLRESIARKGYELAWEKFQPEALGAALTRILEQRFSGMGTGPNRGPSLRFLPGE
jgi:glycosyltransferase involved in cell wall biosynthesis